MTDSRHGLLPAILVLIGLGVGCGGSEPRSHHGPERPVTVLYPVDDYALGPVNSQPSQFLVFSTLVSLDAEGNLEPLLAERWTFEPGEVSEWIVHLRDDARWHDGYPVTAHDVAFTHALLLRADGMDPKDASGGEIEVLDDFTYRVRHRKVPLPELPTLTPRDYYTPIYPRHLLEGLDIEEFYWWEFWKTPVGSGPYRFVRLEPEVAIELEVNADYFDEPATIKSVRLKFGDSSLVEILSGTVDAIAYLPGDDVPMIVDQERFEVYWGSDGHGVSALLWNQRFRPFRDPRLRRALTMAIDRRSIARFLNVPEEIPLVDSLYSTRQFRRGDLRPALAFDPTGAAGLLEEIGWMDTDGDGIRDRAGEALSFSLLVSTGGGASFPAHEREAVLVQEQLRRVGIGVEIDVVDGMAIREIWERGDFEATIYDVLALMRYRLFGVANPMSLETPELFRLMAETRRTLDPEALDDLYEQMAVIFERELPVTFLVPRVRWTVADRRLRGLSSPVWTDPAWYMHRLRWDP